MIKVLHYNPHIDSMITRYVGILVDSMQGKAECHVATSLAQFRPLVAKIRPDIVHLHGCWHSSIAVAAYWGKRHGARIIVSPHGQLEPWVIKEAYFTRRLPRLMAYQRRVIANAYSVIAMGTMEQKALERFTANPRIESVLNALITSRISEKEMGEQVLAIYHKVLDSHTLELMDDTTRNILSSLIKVGITGDERHTSSENVTEARTLTDEKRWRQILLYAFQEDMMPVVLKGIEVMDIVSVPETDVAAVPCYVLQNNSQPTAITPEGEDATEQALHVIKALNKDAQHGRLSMSGIIQLQKLLYEQEVNEDVLAEKLRIKGLDKFTSRLMALMAEKTQLDEGYMIVPSVNDRKTRQLKRIIENRLKI